MSSEQTNNRHDLFVRLFAAHEHQVYGYIVSLVGRFTDADDVMQETAVALWQMFDSFEEGTSFVDWACRVAYFRVLEFRRKTHRDRHQFGKDWLEQFASVAAKQVEGMNAMRDALAICLEKLREPDRQLVRLCYEQGTTIADAAERIGRPTGAVYKSIARIRRVLFDCVRRTMRREEETP
jgi:RNA polymerase sigma-70 factor (ECF subfamily)